MSVEGIGAAYAVAQYSATSRQKNDQNSAPAAVEETRDSVEISEEAVKKSAEARAERTFEGAAASLEDMERELAKKQADYREMLAKAEKETGYDGMMSQTPMLTALRVGPYAQYIPETGQWQYFNEDGTRRDGPVTEKEGAEQLQRSQEKMMNFLNIIRDNSYTEKYAEIARDMTLVGLAKTDPAFRELYESDPEQAVRDYAEQLMDSYSRANYNHRSGVFSVAG